MTVIATIATANGAVMGCDTAYDYYGTVLYGAPKINALTTGDGERVLIGVTGSSSVLSVIGRSLDLEAAPDRDCDDATADAWADQIAAMVVAVMADANPSLLLPADQEESSRYPGALLMAWHRHVWMVVAHSAVRCVSGIAAVGTGTDIALGVMHTATELGVEPRAAVRKAVVLASRLNNGCGIDHRGPILFATDGAG